MMRTIKRIIKIHELKHYCIYCLFNNGESRVINFEKLFDKWKIREGSVEYKLAVSLEEFQKVELVDGTFTWNNIKFESTDENGNKIGYPYDVDPIVMYEESEDDPNRGIDIGLMIKQKRKELGLTQEELASRSGTSKHYISKIENNKSGIELSTLTKIIEGGLGKRIKINIV